MKILSVFKHRYPRSVGGMTIDFLLNSEIGLQVLDLRVRYSDEAVNLYSLV